MSKIVFDEKELELVGRMPAFGDPEALGAPIYKFPISPKEEVKKLYNKESDWMFTGTEWGLFSPKVIPDDVARGFVFEAEMIPMEEFGGPDMFGVEWEYVPVVGGSMVRPGKPLFTDVNEWKEKLLPVWPNPDEWDWEGSAKANKEFLNNGQATLLWLLNGAWFERLISFMEFEDAAVALIDEDQEDALKELLQKLTDLYCHIVDKCVEAYGDGIVGFTVHDDWGSQRAPFFSKEAARNLIVPYMKQFTDHVKSKGMIADFHSCGHIEDQIENIIAAGWQSWTPMAMNDTKKLYEEYGDQIIISICDNDIAPGTPVEEQVKQAKEFASKYYSPDKPSVFSYMYAAGALTDDYRAALYEATRKM
ncbi:Uroporphyrinogen decarboxylase (URO-D) [Acetitomaculum ruminis DSM 5522]|uniref:Uroporphyrinogen decarboxylase (URO-D) n=1 Tax=Acetitomaculum ruminis DSM 5522 TaxID=1120918 RepID=A0A1I0XU56_9FIRM|nr:uroporphyrinogen decarboxylase family protein [Acetitomaculum ruminis]SFB03513.1 Uroporphyrinogen decarboxylase (URO-D) [Acetitomaculum ruminis DSM 5522]